ncbi:probable signal peptidase complex subunit 2 isoform X2 [Aplysia californica]|uniref:Signal peptidase complex subunit 2 n=1 Tax=Aplysia californica TaxID=6500 RepID=A0ABM0K0W8_APLCA|nr:probable signal peptidase complex subunit 2 isoform X2 [Aplysia californica]
MAPPRAVVMDEKPVKIDKWDSGALKNALDDGAKKVLIDILGYKESHALMDGRLLICTIAIGFAMFALIWDYFHPFPLSRNVLMLCVISYFILMGVLTFYLSYVERGIFLVALEQDRAMMEPDNTWKLSSTLRKYDDVYSLTISYTDGKTKQERSASTSKCVASYFDENGVFCFDLFQPIVEAMRQDLALDKKIQ